MLSSITVSSVLLFDIVIGKKMIGGVRPGLIRTISGIVVYAICTSFPMELKIFKEALCQIKKVLILALLAFTSFSPIHSFADMAAGDIK